MSSIVPRAMTPQTLGRLLLAKRLFLNAVSRSQAASDLENILCIQILHNAIEVVLRAIYLHYEIRTSKEINNTFENMLVELDRHSIFSTAGIKLPYCHQLKTLNHWRNMAQHDAWEPGVRGLAELRLYSERFMVRAYREYFALEFDLVSQVDLIANQTLKDLLRLAQEALSNLLIARAMNHLRFAFDLSCEALFAQLTDSGPVRRLDLHGDVDYSLQRFAHDLIGVLNALHHRISTLERSGIILASGVPLGALLRFQRLAPTQTVSLAGHLEIAKQPEVVPADAHWSLEFVTGTIVSWQLHGIAPTFPPWQLRVAEEYMARSRSHTSTATNPT